MQDNTINPQDPNVPTNPNPVVGEPPSPIITPTDTSIMPPASTGGHQEEELWFQQS